MLPTDLGLVLHSRISTAPTTRDAAFVAQCAAITSRKGGGAVVLACSLTQHQEDLIKVLRLAITRVSELKRVATHDESGRSGCCCWELEGNRPLVDASPESLTTLNSISSQMMSHSHLSFGATIET